MKLPKIAQCISMTALMCSAQAFAVPVDSAPVAVNFSGNVTAGTCSIVGDTASQVIDLGDMTTLEVNNASRDPNVPSNSVSSEIAVTGCPDITSGMFIKVALSGTAGSNSQSFRATSGTGTGLDFVVKMRMGAENGSRTVEIPLQPAIAYYAIGSSSGITTSPGTIHRLPIEVGVIRNTDSITSGNMSMLANITVTYS